MSPNDTTEDRLRDALAEVADSTHLSPDAWARVEQRARRRRVPRAALALAAALGAVAVTLAVVIIARNDDGPSVTTADDPTDACGAAAPADVEVLLDPDVSTAQRDAVEAALGESPLVSDASFQSKEEGARVFSCVYANEPATIAAANLDRIPPVFHVTVTEGADPGALIRQLEGEPGIFNVGAGQCSTPADLEVFLDVGATPEAVAAVQVAIEQAPATKSLVFVSKETAYEQFVCLFVAQPDLVAATTAEALPPSFRVTLETGADRAAARRNLEAVPGVDTVTDTRGPIASPLPELELDDFGPPPEGYTEIGAGYDAGGLPWRLSLRTEAGARFSAIVESTGSELALESVDDATGWESLARSPDGLTVGSVRPGVARVRIETAASAAFEVDTVTAPDLRGGLFVAHVFGQGVTVVALDDAGNELYRVEHQATGP